MATLNIKGFPDGLHRKLKARAKKNRRSVAQEVTQLLFDSVDSPKPLSSLDLSALWRVDPAAGSKPRGAGE